MKALHAAGIQVIVDVVYNHTAEGGAWLLCGAVGMVPMRRPAIAARLRTPVRNRWSRATPLAQRRCLSQGGTCVRIAIPVPSSFTPPLAPPLLSTLNAGGDDDPYLLSWRGIDAGVYYQQDPASHAILNFSGCGNTVAANHPLVQDQILTSLRWWVEEYHVDGFRFDLAPCLCRGQDGEPLATPPAIEAMSKDPMLSKVGRRWAGGGPGML